VQTWIWRRSRRVPAEHAVVAPARLVGYRVAFFGHNPVWDSGLETLVAEVEAETWGVLYRLRAAEWDRLDTCVGATIEGSGAYFHYPVEVVTSNDERHQVRTYRKSSQGRLVAEHGVLGLLDPKCSFTGCSGQLSRPSARFAVHCGEIPACQEWPLGGVSTCRCFDQGNRSVWESSTVRSRRTCFACIVATVQVSTRSQKWPRYASSVAPFTLIPTPATTGGSSVATAALPSIAIHARPADAPSTAEIPRIRDALTAASEGASAGSAGVRRNRLIECSDGVAAVASTCTGTKGRSASHTFSANRAASTMSWRFRAMPGPCVRAVWVGACRRAPQTWCCAFHSPSLFGYRLVCARRLRGCRWLVRWRIWL
jgi:hypothetical protein